LEAVLPLDLVYEGTISQAGFTSTAFTILLGKTFVQGIDKRKV